MRLEKNFQLVDYNSYKIRSLASLALFPESNEELKDCFVKYPDAIIWGGGNNIILSKSHYKNPIIFIRDNLKKINILGNQIEVQAGLQMFELSNILLKSELAGFESFCDIPGCIGGGIIMNAGTGDDQISNHLISVTAFDKETNKFLKFAKSECEFDYRNSIFKNNNALIVISAVFQFESGNYNSIKYKMDTIRETRHSKQPIEFPNAGSVFKRPDGYYVGTMIESLGLKGYSIGDAQVSEKHAGFIINKGNATGDDILKLISHIQLLIFNQYNVHLELEQIII
ncbi:MAG: UDP-N-acetylmuramate dehydrogenase [Bacteroidia bacterium]